MATSIIRPVHAGIDVSFTITTSQWSGSAAPYTYAWTDSRVTEGCRVEVEYASTTLDTSALYIEYEKQSGGGGINFSTQTKPTANVCLTVHIINAQTGNVQAVTGADVSTSAISGAANVNEALSSLNSNISIIRKLQYVDVTDSTPINVKSITNTAVNFNNFVGCTSQTNGVMALPYTNSNMQYIKLVNPADLTPYSGSATVRVWYI